MNLNNKDTLLKQTALYYAAREGHLEAVKILVENGIDINIKDYKNQYALNYAKLNNHMNIVEYFYEIKDDWEELDQKIVSTRQRDSMESNLIYNLIYTD